MNIWRADFQNHLHPLLYMLLLFAAQITAKKANFQHKIECKCNMLILIEI